MANAGATEPEPDAAEDASLPEEAPQIVVDLTGEIVELNPAARETFPELSGQGLDHPLLSKAPGWLRRLDDQGTMTEEVYAGGQPYLIHLAWDSDAQRFIFTVSRV